MQISIKATAQSIAKALPVFLIKHHILFNVFRISAASINIFYLQKNITKYLIFFEFWDIIIFVTDWTAIKYYIHLDIRAAGAVRRVAVNHVRRGTEQH